MDLPPRGLVQNRVAKTLAILVASAVAFLSAIPVARSGRVFQSKSIAAQLVEFPVGSPAGMLTGFAFRNVTLAALAGWAVYVLLGIAVVRSNRLGMVVGGLLLLVGMFVLNVLSVWVMAGLNGLR